MPEDNAKKVAYLIAAGLINDSELAEIVRQYHDVLPDDVVDEDDWTLNSDQMIFMLQHHNVIEQAYAQEDAGFICELSNSDEYKSLFGVMTFNEAYDRYESALEAGRGDP
jgi:hypothetical protein